MRLQRVWTLLALLTVACGAHPAPVLTPAVPRSAPLELGANDCFHCAGMSPDIEAEWCTWRAPWIRTPQLSAASLAAHLAAVTCPSVKTLALVEGPDPALAGALAAVLPFAAKLEVSNELELAPHNLSPQAYVAAVTQMHDAARAAGFSGEIIAGAVYALTDDTKARVEAVAAACPDCSLGLHIYEVPSAADLAWIRSLHRRIWVTETGSPTNCVPVKLQEQAAYLNGMIATLGTVENIVGVILYQRPAGPTCSNLDTFSIAGKPAEELLK